MRIIHAVSNVAGLPVAFAAAQRQAGHRAAAVVYDSPFYHELPSVDLGRLVQGNRITRRLRRARVLAWAIGSFDVFHFHYSTTFMSNQEDLRLLKALGKKIVFHMHGCDIRDPRLVRARYATSACAECTIQCMTPVKLRMPETLAHFADAVIVSTPDLLDFVPCARYMPNPIDPRPWDILRLQAPGDATPRGDLVVVHAPTSREIKGTRHIEAAIGRLQAEGLAVRLLLLEGMPQDRLRRACLAADIAVDQVLVGWHGLFALEMMALGKPVVAYIREDLAHVHPDIPVGSASPDTLVDTLRALLQSEDMRRDLGNRGPDYVRSTHDMRRTSDQLLDLYREIGAPA